MARCAILEIVHKVIEANVAETLAEAIAKDGEKLKKPIFSDKISEEKDTHQEILNTAEKISPKENLPVIETLEENEATLEKKEMPDWYKNYEKAVELDKCEDENKIPGWYKKYQTAGGIVMNGDVEENDSEIEKLSESEKVEIAQDTIQHEDLAKEAEITEEIEPTETQGTFHIIFNLTF